MKVFTQNFFFVNIIMPLGEHCAKGVMHSQCQGCVALRAEKAALEVEFQALIAQEAALELEVAKRTGEIGQV